jgi:hypothetical protein
VSAVASMALVVAIGAYLWHRRRTAAPPVIAVLPEKQSPRKCPPELIRAALPRKARFTTAMREKLVRWVLLLVGAGVAVTQVHALPRLQDFSPDAGWGFAPFVVIGLVLHVRRGLRQMMQKQLLAWGRTACGIVTRVESFATCSTHRVLFRSRRYQGRAE